MRGLVISALTFMTMAGAIALALIPVPMAEATTTTVIGWLVPDGTHWNNGIGALLFPLAGVGLLAGMGKVLDIDGDFGTTLILAGVFAGSALAMLSINTSNANVTPFALVIVPGIDLAIWLWKGNS